MIPNHISAPNSIFVPILGECISRGQTAEFRVRGYSMRPYIEHERDIAIIAPITRELSVRDVVLAKIGEKTYALHRIIAIQGNELTLMGDGNIGGTEHCKTSDVIGIATGFKRKGRERIETTEGIKWRWYSQLWPRLLPLRRWLLAFDRRIPILRWLL